MGNVTCRSDTYLQSVPLSPKLRKVLNSSTFTLVGNLSIIHQNVAVTMSITAPLDRYIRRALRDERAQIFCRSPLSKPTLVKGKVNRILTNRGCFNSPHQGHMDTVTHGFFRGGADLNIIAAIVFFVPYSSVRAEYTHHGDDTQPIVFKLEERIKLFNSGAFHSGWHDCYPLDIDH